ncbi:MAG: M48 family metallopeptidase [Pirellulaceae bacterium]|nr:M48 family metallopeptidase [Pirellulaceae bacterium]
MTTQFFERQDSARSQTTRLLFLFVLAVLAIVIALSVFGYLAGNMVNEANSRQQNFRSGTGNTVSPWLFAALFGGGSLIVIVLGSLYQVSQLKFGGGTRVAESVGGRQLAHHTSDPLERRLLNVVEEMAIASGTPVPPVYMMDETGINAFAAGYMPSDAVVGVTRGAIENLSRDELQGVIAHEFSHIFNGDMRTNIRLIGVLHGILVLSLIGHMLLRSLRYVSTGSGNKNSGGIVVVLLILGLVLVVLGSLGSFLGGLIKAAVSRQREFLADASAVQFTRNPLGISGALKRIGGVIYGSKLQHPNAAMASHMYFAQGVFEGLSGLMATHPPLPKRIAAIEPTWDGSFFATAAETSVRAGQALSGTASAAAAGMSGLAPTARMSELDPPRQVGGRSERSSAGTANVGGRTISVPEMMGATDRVGAPQDEHRVYAHRLLEQLDPVLIQAAHEPYSARALVMALLIDPDPALANQQLAILQRMVPVDLLNAVVTLLPPVKAMANAARLPLIDMSLPMLRMMSLPQYQAFIPAFQALVQADQRLSVFEWTLSQVLYRHLHVNFMARPVVPTQYHSLAGLKSEVSVLLTTLARTGNSEPEVDRAFAAAAGQLPGLPLSLVSAELCTFAELEKVVQKLAQASAKLRRQVLMACAACVSSDNVVRIREVELVRGIADLLDCPMPPLVGRQE